MRKKQGKIKNKTKQNKPTHPRTNIKLALSKILDCVESD